MLAFVWDFLNLWDLVLSFLLVCVIRARAYEHTLNWCLFGFNDSFVSWREEWKYCITNIREQNEHMRIDFKELYVWKWCSLFLTTTPKWWCSNETVLFCFLFSLLVLMFCRCHLFVMEHLSENGFKASVRYEFYE